MSLSCSTAILFSNAELRTIFLMIVCLLRRKQYGGRKVRDADGPYVSFWDAK